MRDSVYANGNKAEITEAPSGRRRMKWLGPAFIWMLSAAGSGELLFTPRVAAQYGYTLIWALLLAVLMKWFINREIGRYTVSTGATFFQGVASMKNKSWLLWLIMIPQLFVAVATVAGLAGASATAVIVLVDIPVWIPAVGLTIITSLVVSFQVFSRIEKITMVLAMIITLSILTASISAGPDLGAMAQGLVPQVPEGVKVDEVLSWLGFMLAGAAGLMWFSYWTAAKGYGAASAGSDKPVDVFHLDDKQRKNLRAWMKHVTIANTLAVVGALVIALAFLVLGTELLKPEGLIPQENEVARVLGRLLGGVWGQFGFWFMICAVFITFASTILSDQDGFARMFADGTSILGKNSGWKGKWVDVKFLKKLFVWTILAAIPMVTYLFAGEPVALLKMAGAIEASHIPIVTGIILYLNRKKLPKELQASTPVFIATIIAGLFFAAFAILYILSEIGVLSF